MPPPKKPHPLAAGLSRQIEQAAIRQGIGAWLQELAHTKGAERVETSEGLLAFLGDDPAVRLTVILKKGLKSATGVVPRESVTADGFILSDSPADSKAPRRFRYAEISIYFLPATQQLAVG